MKQIRICYVDFWKELVPETFLFTEILRQYYDIIMDEENPDFVFCSHFGTEYLKYDCPRILYLGEAKCPDFNIYDYAIAFDDIQFGDRYIRYPFYLLRRKSLEKALKKHTHSNEYYLAKQKFCNFVVSNGPGADNIRNYYFDELSKYKRVDSGGGYRNNLPDGKPVEDKLKFQEEFKFSLAFENSGFPGYITEKITDAWAAGTIPIYWGAPEIEKEFNSKAFLNCRNFATVDGLIAKIREIENDEKLFLDMMKQPVLLPESPVYDMMNPNYLGDFFCHIFDQAPEDAYRRNSKLTMWGRAYEHHISRWNEAEKSFVGNAIRKTLRLIRR